MRRLTGSGFAPFSSGVYQGKATRLPSALAAATATAMVGTLALPEATGTSDSLSFFPASSHALRCARRHFWNPFASKSEAVSSPSAVQDPVGQRNAEQHAKIVEEAHRNADLQNEQLLDACLKLLELCGGSASGAAPSDLLGDMERDRIWVLVDVLLHEHRRPPADQFDLAYAALCLPAAQNHRLIQRYLLIVLQSVIPETLFRVFESVDLFVTGSDDHAMHQRASLFTFMHAQLGELRVIDGVAEEEVLAVYMDDLKQCFPALTTCPAWAVVEQEATDVALKARLFALLGHLCAEFDTDRSGKVKVADLRATAERVLGREKAALLLEGAQGDKEGKIPYPQLAALLTRPPPRAVSSKEKKGEKESLQPDR